MGWLGTDAHVMGVLAPCTQCAGAEGRPLFGPNMLLKQGELQDCGLSFGCPINHKKDATAAHMAVHMSTNAMFITSR